MFEKKENLKENLKDYLNDPVQNVKWGPGKVLENF